MSRLGTLTQGAVGGLLSRIDRLDDWCPDSPPERTNYQALWREAISPVHPIIDARVRLRTVEQSIEDRYGCRQRPITGELDALERVYEGRPRGGDAQAVRLPRLLCLDRLQQS